MSDVIKGSWKEFKGKVKKKWGKLTDNDLTEIEGKAEELTGKLQKIYGLSKEKAEKEYQDFKKSL